VPGRTERGNSGGGRARASQKVYEPRHDPAVRADRQDGPPAVARAWPLRSVPAFDLMKTDPILPRGWEGVRIRCLHHHGHPPDKASADPSRQRMQCKARKPAERVADGAREGAPTEAQFDAGPAVLAVPKRCSPQQGQACVLGFAGVPLLSCRTGPPGKPGGSFSLPSPISRQVPSRSSRFSSTAAVRLETLANHYSVPRLTELAGFNRKTEPDAWFGGVTYAK
jgi:hypothetical protein